MSFYTRFGGGRTATTDLGVIMGPDKDGVCKNRSNFFIFYIFADIPSMARSTPGEGGAGKYRPPYQAPRL